VRGGSRGDFRYDLTRVRVGAFRKAFARARGMCRGLSLEPYARAWHKKRIVSDRGQFRSLPTPTRSVTRRGKPPSHKKLAVLEALLIVEESTSITLVTCSVHSCPFGDKLQRIPCIFRIPDLNCQPGDLESSVVIASNSKFQCSVSKSLT
jgi:hypothetical protein